MPAEIQKRTLVNSFSICECIIYIYRERESAISTRFTYINPTNRDLEETNHSEVLLVNLVSCQV